MVAQRLTQASRERIEDGGRDGSHRNQGHRAFASEGAIGQELNWRMPCINRLIVVTAGQTFEQRTRQVAGQLVSAENSIAAAVSTLGFNWLLEG